jgi:hypothetical protein
MHSVSATPADAHQRPSPSNSIDDAIATLAEASIDEVQSRSYDLQKREYYSALNDLPFPSANLDLWHDRSLPRAIVWDLDTPAR